MKIAFQGEPGAYSEKAAKEFLGQNIISVPCISFEETFKSVVSKEVDYAVVPIENSLGGSIHINFDLLLRYDLHIIAEHDFRVQHSLLALPGVKKEDIKKVLSHPQALAQCDNYLRIWGVDREDSYDTAGSAKIIKEKDLKNCAAIASDLAGQTYGLEVLDTNIEDHDNNFTRFLLLGRQPVSSLLPPNMPSKTSIVFVLPNNPGALYKALACFSLRDIDFCKIESRPTSLRILQFLQNQQNQNKISENHEESMIQFQGNLKKNQSNDIPKFRYTFYLDFLASQFDEKAQNALSHLKEQSHFVRVLGSYPQSGQLLDSIFNNQFPSHPVVNYLKIKKSPLKIGIIGFGNFGQFLAKTFIKNNDIYCVDRDDMSKVARDLGCEYFPLYDLSEFEKINLDIIILSVSIISFEDVLKNIDSSIFKGKLIIDVLSVKMHAKSVMLKILPEDCDIICTHPMFGPESGKYGWQGLTFLYEKVRISDTARSERFLQLWESERCKMIEMSCELHDQYAASSQFITHLMGRILWQQNLVPTPIDTKGFQTVLNLVENTCKDSFDLFFGLYYYNQHASNQITKIHQALAQVEKQLASKVQYLSQQKD